jgi:hypothetical protein
MSVYKVVEKGITTEMLPGPAPSSKPKKEEGDFMAKYNAKEGGTELTLPDKVFVIRTEKMRPYKRLDYKF